MQKNRSHTSINLFLLAYILWFISLLLYKDTLVISLLFFSCVRVYGVIINISQNSWIIMIKSRSLVLIIYLSKILHMRSMWLVNLSLPFLQFIEVSSYLELHSRHSISESHVSLFVIARVMYLLYDVDYAGDPTDRKPTIRFYIFLGDSLIFFWKSYNL